MSTVADVLQNALNGAPALARAQATCAHCGLPVPAGLIDAEATEQFCCNGCRTVYAVIHSCGLERYYAMRAAADAPAIPARGAAHTYAEFDDPAFQATYCRPASGDIRTIELFLEGVHCPACVWLVEKLPRVCRGVIEARLRMRESCLTLTWNQAEAPLSRAARALESLGYPPHPARDASARRLRQRAERGLLIRIGVAGAIAGNVMLLALALYSGMFSGMEPVYQQLFRWLSMVLAVVSVCWPGAVFFRGAMAALRTRTAHLDLPIALGIGVGAAAGVAHTIRGTGEIYFDSITVLIFLLLVGRLIQQRQQRWAADAVELLFNLAPSVARRLEEGRFREVAVQALRPDDVVEVRAGESIPADGTVLVGRSSVDQKLLTGESRPTAVEVGSELFAGTVNLAGLLRLRVRATGDQTRVATILRLVEDCSRLRAPIVQRADRVAGWFVVAVLIVAMACLVAWWPHNPRGAIENTIALLIVTCPCGLGLATPLAMTIAIGRAARRGILVKGGGALERLAGYGTMILDKTGTLTQGCIRLVRWQGPAEILRWAAAVERCSSHPIARAFVDAAGPAADISETEQESEAVSQFVETTGAGVRARLNGRRIHVGSIEYVGAQDCHVSDTLAQTAAQWAKEGVTPVCISVNGDACALAGFADPLRDGAAEALDALKRRGWRLELLSGDHADVVAEVADKLRIEPGHAFGRCSPEQKLAHVRDRKRSGLVVMVGDGVNDAAALADADVGVAVHGGAEASLAAADLYLQDGRPDTLVETVDGARRTLGVIGRAMRFSLAYNLLGASLAAAGWLNPLIAAILMPLSSLSVLGIAYSGRTFDGPSSQREP